MCLRNQENQAVHDFDEGDATFQYPSYQGKVTAPPTKHSHKIAQIANVNCDQAYLVAIGWDEGSVDFLAT